MLYPSNRQDTIEHPVSSSVESWSERARTVTTEATHKAKATKTGILFMFFIARSHFNNSNIK